MQFHMHPQPRKVLQTPDVIAILYEGNAGVSQIFTDGRTIPANEPQPWWYGYSVGRWVDDYNFVVNSNGTDERTWLDNAGNPHSDQLRVEERWTRVSKNKIELTVVIDDPKTYTKPWVALDKLPMVQIPPNTDLMEMMNAASEVQAVAAQFRAEANSK